MLANCVTFLIARDFVPRPLVQAPRSAVWCRGRERFATAQLTASRGHRRRCCFPRVSWGRRPNELQRRGLRKQNRGVRLRKGELPHMRTDGHRCLLTRLRRRRCAVALRAHRNSSSRTRWHGDWLVRRRRGCGQRRLRGRPLRWIKHRCRHVDVVIPQHHRRAARVVHQVIGRHRRDRHHGRAAATPRRHACNARCRRLRQRGRGRGQRAGRGR